MIKQIIKDDFELSFEDRYGNIANVACILLQDMACEMYVYKNVKYECEFTLPFSDPELKIVVVKIAKYLDVRIS